MFLKNKIIIVSFIFFFSLSLYHIHASSFLSRTDRNKEKNFERYLPTMHIFHKKYTSVGRVRWGEVRLFLCKWAGRTTGRQENHKSWRMRASVERPLLPSACRATTWLYLELWVIFMQMCVIRPDRACSSSPDRGRSNSVTSPTHDFRRRQKIMLAADVFQNKYFDRRFLYLSPAAVDSTPGM